MIGVIAENFEEDVVREFFELFKTPWQFYEGNKYYDVILSGGDNISEVKANLVVIYKSEKTSFDFEKGLTIRPLRKNPLLESNGKIFPIYGEVTSFGIDRKSVIRVKGTNEAIGVEINEKDKKILRIGFDLFHEIRFLLSSGQPIEYASIPTLEIHIALLRNWILHSGIPLIEIPPFPSEYNFMACLTHDVDFVNIRNHKFDHTLCGFLYRALFGSLINVLKRKTPLRKLLKNWKAVFSLPLVYLGVVEDFMVQFDRYIEIENGLGSTFFVFPYKNQEGKSFLGKAPKKRAAKYDVNDIKTEIKKLVTNSYEIGLHGIDAWNDTEKGREEREKISDIIGESKIGVRMHWLYFCNASPKILEEAGFYYDSTLGYNETVGYRGGTGQVFRPRSVKRLLELPLIIQDTALFYPSRMGLTETEAFEIVRELIINATMYGGVITINWHHRSIGPERLWDEFYIALLNELRSRKTWFGTARQVVQWFNKRRSVTFNHIISSENKINVEVKSINDAGVPDLVLRTYYPVNLKSTDGDMFADIKVSDIPFTGGFKGVIFL